MVCKCVVTGLGVWGVGLIGIWVCAHMCVGWSACGGEYVGLCEDG